MATVKDLLLDANLFDVLFFIEAQYTGEGGACDYADVVNRLLSMDPTPDSMTVHIEKMVEEDSTHFHVNGVDQDGEAWALEFSPWSEWLGMEVVLPDSMPAEEALAHILWEMTWCGIQEEDVDQARAHLNSFTC